MPRVLIIEDEYALAAALSTVIRRLGAEPVVAASGQGGLDKAQRQAFDLVLLDIGLPDMSGLKVLASLRAQESPPKVLIITAHGTLENALEARRLGAEDYFLKPLNLAELQPCLRALLMPLKDEPVPVVVGAEPHQTLMIGASPGMQRCFAVLAQACATDAPVLLSGPRGAGKTLAAEVIHRNSAGAEVPLAVFRADEWPEAEMESALAKALAATQHGTLLIEEIATLPLPLQAWVTRSITERGRRVLATTSLPLADLILAGRFREDLYYQLAVLQVLLPPLHERVEDIPTLASFLLNRAAPHRDLMLAPETLACLKGYAWPGQVRELATAMQHAVAVCSSRLILPRHLPEAVATAFLEGSDNHLDAALNRVLNAWLDQRVTGPQEQLPDYDVLLAQVEKQMLSALLARFEDKPTRLAAALNMNRATLRRKLRDLLGRE